MLARSVEHQVHHVILYSCGKTQNIYDKYGGPHETGDIREI